MKIPHQVVRGTKGVILARFVVYGSAATETDTGALLESTVESLGGNFDVLPLLDSGSMPDASTPGLKP